MNRWSRQRGAMLTLVVIAVLIAGFVYALLQPRWSERPIAEVNAAVDSSRLAVTVHHNECGNVGPRVRVVSESEESVVLSAEQNERGGCADIGLTSVVAVDLDAPLGSRDLLFDPEDTSNSVRCLIDGQRIEQCG